MVAGWGQVAVLIVTACFVLGYLRETQQLRQAAQQQVQAANEQAEALIRPVVVVRMHTKTRSLMAQNVGKGCALNLRLTNRRALQR
jgi:hypothetical protein